MVMHHRPCNDERGTTEREVEMQNPIAVERENDGYKHGRSEAMRNKSAKPLNHQGRDYYYDKFRVESLYHVQQQSSFLFRLKFIWYRRRV